MTDTDQVRRILLVRPSALGDVCRTVPVLVSLKRANPTASIDWLVQEGFEAAIASHPDLHHLIPFPRKRFAKWYRDPAVAGEMRRWFSDLRHCDYDLVIDCQGLGRSGLITWMTRAPNRVGYRDAREFGWLGYTRRAPRRADDHAVDQMMSLVRSCGFELVYDLRLYLDDADRVWWAGQRAAKRLAGDDYAVLAPTARWITKRWPIERWGDLLTPLRERGIRRFVVVGAPGEQGQVRPLTEGTDACLLDLVGETTVGQTMAVIAEASIVIANDSAPLHMAVGFERPCVGLFGPTDPAIVGPWGRLDSVVQPTAVSAGPRPHYRDRRLGDRLMREITAAEVIEALDPALSRAAAIGSAPT